jgi:hypothetical protein
MAALPKHWGAVTRKRWREIEAWKPTCGNPQCDGLCMSYDCLPPKGWFPGVTPETLPLAVQVPRRVWYKRWWIKVSFWWRIGGHL